MVFLVQDGLVEVGDTPPFWNIEVKQLRQLFSCLAGNVVPPSPERYKQVAVLVKRHVAVHHGTDSDRTDPHQLEPVFLTYAGGQVSIAGLDSLPDLFQRVGPDVVMQLVFPNEVPRSNDLVVIGYQDRFDPGRT